jgi:hypothetical protein
LVTLVNIVIVIFLLLRLTHGAISEGSGHLTQARINNTEHDAIPEKIAEISLE